MRKRGACSTGTASCYHLRVPFSPRYRRSPVSRAGVRFHKKSVSHPDTAVAARWPSPHASPARTTHCTSRFSSAWAHAPLFAPAWLTGRCTDDVQGERRHDGACQQDQQGGRPRSDPTAAVAAWALGAPAVCPDRPSMWPNSRRIRLFRSAARDCRGASSPRRGRQLLFTAQTSTGARQCKLVASCSGGVRKGACSTCFLLVKPCTWSRARSRCVGEAILLCSSGWLDSLDRHDLALPRQPLTRQLSSSEKKPHGGLRFCMSRLDSRHV